MYLDKPLRIDSIGRKFAKEDGVTQLRQCTYESSDSARPTCPRVDAEKRGMCFVSAALRRFVTYWTPVTASVNLNTFSGPRIIVPGVGPL